MILLIMQAYHPRAMSRAELHRSIRELALVPTNYLSMDDDVSPSSCDGTIRGITREVIQKAAGMNRKPSIALDNDVRSGHDLHDADAVVVVCGSAFIMAEVRAALSIIEPRDGDILSDQSSKGDNNYRDMQVSFHHLSLITYLSSPVSHHLSLITCPSTCSTNHLLIMMYRLGLL